MHNLHAVLQVIEFLAAQVSSVGVVTQDILLLFKHTFASILANVGYAFHMFQHDISLPRETLREFIKRFDIVPIEYQARNGYGSTCLVHGKFRHVV